MTVNTPFPDRPATPWLVNYPPTPLGAFDLSNVTDPISNVFHTLHETETGMYIEQRPDGSVITYRQPPGSYSLPVGNVTGQLGTNVTGSLSTGTGVWILLAIGAAFLFFGRGRR